MTNPSATVAGLSEYLTEVVSRLKRLQSIDDAEAARLGNTVVDAIESETSQLMKEIKELRRSIAARMATFVGQVQRVRTQPDKVAGNTL